MNSSDNEMNCTALTAGGPLLYTLANRDYFEPLDRVPVKGDYKKHISSLLPRQWIVQDAGIWYRASAPGATLPGSGFKIHISSTLEHAAALLNLVLPVLVAAEVRFKVLRSANHLALANSKFFPRAAAHKFITIYPVTTQLFIELAQTLDLTTAGFVGPRVLSDKPVNGSRVVSYRFGGFRPVPRLTTVGTKEQLIRDATGRWMADVRAPYFTLPEGMEDPFPDAPASDVGGPLVLGDRFLVTRALAFSTCGGTYIATDRETDREVLVKEARPLTTISHTASWLCHATDAMHREGLILQKLSSLSCVPRHIAAFEQGGHAFSVQEYIPASPFAKFRAQDSVMLGPFEGDVGQANSFCENFQAIASNLIAAVMAVHRRQVIIGDISAGNILVHEDRRVFLIDFESSWDRSRTTTPDLLSKAWSTVGFARGGGRGPRELTYEDDWYAVGMVMFSMLLPVNRLDGLDPYAHERFLDAISDAARLPRWVAETIRHLLGGRPAAASALLRGSWPPVPPVPCEAQAPCSGVIKASHVRVPDTALRGALSGIADHILGTLDLGRRDVLGPSDYRAHQTNPLSLAYGA